MRLLIAITCILAFLSSGCAMRKYTSKRFLGTVDTQTKVLSSTSRFELELSYDGGELVVAAVKQAIMFFEFVSLGFLMNL